MSILVGNNISNIFNINKEPINNKECCRFYSIVDYDNTIDYINNYFISNYKNTLFIKLENNKCIIDIIVREYDHLSLIYSSYRLNKFGKFIYFLSLKKVLLSIT